MMTRFLPVFLVLAMIGVILPDSGRAGFSGRLGTWINQVNANVFEVIPRSSGSGPVFWCGAADYAHRGLGASWSAQLYIARGRGPSETTKRRSAVQFTLDPGAAGISPSGPSYSLNSLRVGDHMSVQQAYLYCNQAPMARF